MISVLFYHFFRQLKFRKIPRILEIKNMKFWVVKKVNFCNFLANFAFFVKIFIKIFLRKTTCKPPLER